MNNKKLQRQKYLDNNPQNQAAVHTSSYVIIRHPRREFPWAGRKDYFLFPE